MASSRDRFERYVPAVQLFAARLVLFHMAVAERLGLTATEFKCFRLIEQLGPLSLSTLAREAGLQLGTASGLVDRLESLDMVERRRDASDGRRISLTAAPGAATHVADQYLKQKQGMGEVLGSFNDREFDAILRFLTQAAEVLARSQSAVQCGPAADAV